MFLSNLVLFLKILPNLFFFFFQVDSQDKFNVYFI
jgi:hypothetical protein